MCVAQTLLKAACCNRLPFFPFILQGRRERWHLKPCVSLSSLVFFLRLSSLLDASGKQTEAKSVSSAFFSLLPSAFENEERVTTTHILSLSFTSMTTPGKGRKQKKREEGEGGWERKQAPAATARLTHTPSFLLSFFFLPRRGNV